MNLHPMLYSGQLCERRRFGGIDIFEPKHSGEIYHRHNDWVRRVVPQDRLLQFNPADGWEPLCRFLNVPVPTGANGEKLPYPRTNDTTQYRRLYWILMNIGIFSWLLLLTAIYLMTRYLVRYLVRP